MTTSQSVTSSVKSQIALEAIESIPRRENEPVFNEPWEAEVFSLVLTLQEQGVFTWKEWVSLLSDTIYKAQAAGDPDFGDTYYLHWLNALELLVINKNLGGSSQLTALYRAWDEAARNTPHGLPIELPQQKELLR